MGRQSSEGRAGGLAAACEGAARLALRREQRDHGIGQLLATCAVVLMVVADINVQGHKTRFRPGVHREVRLRQQQHAGHACGLRGLVLRRLKLVEGVAHHRHAGCFSQTGARGLQVGRFGEQTQRRLAERKIQQPMVAGDFTRQGPGGLGRAVHVVSGQGLKNSGPTQAS
jgi:hypothetical protein